MAEVAETTPSGMMNFASKKNKAKERSKQQNIEKNVAANKERSAAAKSKPKDNKKITSTVEIGKAFVDQFFHGFSEVDRANILADLDDDVVFRISDVYEDRIQSFVSEEYQPVQQQEKEEELYRGLVGGLSLGMAVKLNKSATESEKQKNFGLSAISNIKVKEPKQAAVILDSIGKTDLPNDNHFRLNDQHYAAKRHMVRGTHLIMRDTQLTDYLRDDRGNQYTFKKFRENLLDPEYFSNMIDDSSTSVDRIKRIGKKVYEEATNKNIEFEVDSAKFMFRLPKFELPDEMTITDVGKILGNAFFEKFKADNTDLAKAMAGLILSITKQNWLLNPSKKMYELDNVFRNTFFEQFSFYNIMDFCKVWNINDYFKTEDLNSLAIDAINKWNTSTTKVLGRFLDIIELDFSEHGTEAQLIQVDRNNIELKHTNVWGWKTFRFKNKAVSRTPLKTSSHAALMGVFTGLTKNIRFKSDFIVNHDKNNRQLLTEFLKKDFR